MSTKKSSTVSVANKMVIWSERPWTNCTISHTGHPRKTNLGIKLLSFDVDDDTKKKNNVNY